MRNRKSSSRAAAASSAVSAFIADQSRKRRRTHRALTEIGEHAPVARRNDLSPRLEIATVPTERLKPASRQVRRRDPVQAARVRTSIERFGVCRPVLVDADFTIVEGHGLWEAAKELGVAELPCVVVDHLNPNELRLLRIALNRIGELGEWEPEALRLEFEELIDLGEDVVLTGFEMAEVDVLLLEDGAEATEDDENIAALTVESAVTQSGDLWLLGDHRLLCGDARDRSAYDRLLDQGEAARLLLTDEPFNVPNVGHVTGNARHREFAMANGEMSNEEFLAFNLAWMETALPHIVDGGLLGTFIDWRSVELVLASGRQLDLTLLNIVVWVKSNGGQGSLWRSQHELLPVFKKGSAPHINNVELGRFGRWRANTWFHPGASSLGSDAREGLEHHPTTKPRKLLEDALLDVTNRGDTLLEPFAGSGSTLLAAETTGRSCRAIEIDALYCDLAIRRWENLTGREARLAGTGETFAEVGARRSSGQNEARRPDADADRFANFTEEGADDERA